MSDPHSTFALPIALDRESSIPLYDQIARPLEELILSGALPPGQLIEDEVSMAQRLQVSRPTARRALQDLVNRGLLTRRRGIGTRVTPTHVRRPLSLTSLQDDLTKAGFNPSTDVLHYEVRLATLEDAEHLHISPGEEVVHIARLRRIDGHPLAILHNIIPAAFAPSITQLSHDGLYAALNSAGIQPTSAQQSIGARLSEESEAEYLNIEHPAPVLTMQRTAYDASGRVVEFGDHVYNPERYSFHLTLTSE